MNRINGYGAYQNSYHTNTVNKVYFVMVMGARTFTLDADLGTYLRVGVPVLMLAGAVVSYVLWNYILFIKCCQQSADRGRRNRYQQNSQQSRYRILQVSLIQQKDSCEIEQFCHEQYRGEYRCHGAVHPEAGGYVRGYPLKFFTSSTFTLS